MTRWATTGAGYDDAGNVVAWNGNAHEYDGAGMMSRNLSGGEDWRYIYTADDERFWAYRIGGSGSVWTLRGLDGKALREYDAHASWSTFRDYVYRDGQLLSSVYPGEGQRQFHLDHLGTPRAITQSTSAPQDVVWVEDSVPAGAVAGGESEGWSWVGASPPPFSGSLGHQSALVSGLHQHYFYGASSTLSVNPGDVLVAYVYLDPANPPSEVMLQWGVDGWEHRAYWGANLIGFGTDGTNSRRYMGPLPPAGQWVRLEVPASLVGLEGKTLHAMAFTLWGGRATWDHAGKRAGSTTVWVEDSLPDAAAALGEGEGWTWVSANPAPFSGSLSHQSALVSGLHQHYFCCAASTLPVNAGDALFAYVYLDPVNPPSEVMLQWNDGSWEHRAYWGANQIGFGVDGTASRRYMGALPAAGQWVRLEVPASLVGLEGRSLNGMAFTLWGGKATWDHAGKTAASAQGGILVSHHVYFPFGEQIGTSQDVEQMKFTGHERDRLNTAAVWDDLDYMHARHYNPLVARFLSVDPVLGSARVPQSWNRYAYVRGNPVKYTDPYGLCDTDMCIDVVTEPPGDSYDFTGFNNFLTFGGLFARGGYYGSSNDRGSQIIRDVGLRTGAVADAGEFALGFTIGADLTDAIDALLEGDMGSAGLAVGMALLPGSLSGLDELKGFTKHGVNQAISRDVKGVARGVKTSAIRDALANPVKVVRLPNGQTRYIGRQATVVLRSDGKVITVWARSSSAYRIP